MMTEALKLRWTTEQEGCVKDVSEDRGELVQTRHQDLLLSFSFGPGKPDTVVTNRLEDKVPGFR